MKSSTSKYARYGSDVLTSGERFWTNLTASAEFHDLLRYSAIMSILPFSGYLFYYTVVGKIWNYFPFIQSVLSIPRAIMCAGLQWVFFTTFPLLSSLFIDTIFSRNAAKSRFQAWNVITTYSMTPLYLAGLWISAPFFGRIAVLFGMATFLYLHYYGCRAYAGQGIVRSALITVITVTMFATIRQMFVYVIGF